MGKLELEDIRPYLQGVKQKGAETVATCPLCGKRDHLYIKQDGERLLMHCHKCNAKGTELFKEFRRLGAKHEEPEQINYKTAAPTEDLPPAEWKRTIPQAPSQMGRRTQAVYV